MTVSKLKPALRNLVQEHGMGKVLKSLGELAEVHRGSTKKKTTKRKPRLTATQYVMKIGLPAEKSVAVAGLARRFERKEFLPNFRSVAEFCRVYQLKVPASKSRASAIPRVFKSIADMEVKEIERIRDEGMFSGPSRLGPIADAIRNFSRTPTPTHSE